MLPGTDTIVSATDCILATWEVDGSTEIDVKPSAAPVLADNGIVAKTLLPDGGLVLFAGANPQTIVIFPVVFASDMGVFSIKVWSKPVAIATSPVSWTFVVSKVTSALTNP